MLEQVVKHSGVDLELRCQGDLEIDEHHTVEGCALALGEAFKQALGDKRGIARHGFTLPMDEALAQVALDFSGRSYLQFKCHLKREHVGDFPTELLKHFFESFVSSSDLTLNITVEGENEHHMIESVFKAFGKAIKQALTRDFTQHEIPSTKGLL